MPLRCGPHAPESGSVLMTSLASRVLWKLGCDFGGGVTGSPAALPGPLGTLPWWPELPCHRDGLERPRDSRRRGTQQGPASSRPRSAGSVSHGPATRHVFSWGCVHSSALGPSVLWRYLGHLAIPQSVISISKRDDTWMGSNVQQVAHMVGTLARYTHSQGWGSCPLSGALWAEPCWDPRQRKRADSWVPGAGPRPGPPGVPSKEHGGSGHRPAPSPLTLTGPRQGGEFAAGQESVLFPGKGGNEWPLLCR